MSSSIPTTRCPCTSRLAAQRRRALADGECKAGERMPPALDLAAVLGVNRNTVLRCYAICATKGCSSSVAGRVTVSADVPQRSAVVAKARELMQFAVRIPGISDAMRSCA